MEGSINPWVPPPQMAIWPPRGQMGHNGSLWPLWTIMGSLRRDPQILSCSSGVSREQEPIIPIIAIMALLALLGHLAIWTPYYPI